MTVPKQIAVDHFSFDVTNGSCEKASTTVRVKLIKSLTLKSGKKMDGGVSCGYHHGAGGKKWRETEKFNHQATVKVSWKN